MKKLSRRATIVTKQLTTVAMFTALVTVATIVIAIPAPAGGFLNVGDTVVLIAAACLGPIGGMIAGGLGSCFADLILGYVMYAPFTLVIKGLEGLICGGLIMLFDKTLGKRYKNYIAQIIAGVIAMIVAALTMSSLYCIADGILYGWGAAIVNAPVNLTQGAIGVAAGSVIVYALNLPKIAKRFGVNVVVRDWVSKPKDLSEASKVSDMVDKTNIIDMNVSNDGTKPNADAISVDNDNNGRADDNDQRNFSMSSENNSVSADITASVDSSEIKTCDGKDKIQKSNNDSSYKTDAGRYRK